ncbi:MULTISPECIES: hypothetical protein [unclassified Amycolatopsis]|uniref:hypothetical protein n=1 Tax=unclassified Amycolatopsis TaxID=2618356 RepID=UPI002875DB00|nr:MULTISPECIES: hypothetical protein [unclassified Amycolatopsis]MDS0137585.1 hypothetical protein [Amycolatopsis sp. 505]MDS0141780.1 hypothetical protein [Amycolatopsis sp. CM201R]
MIVREPALPVDPRLPGEPTVLEVGWARLWLGKRGVRVWLPTRLLALRLGGRAIGARGTPTYAIVFAVLWALSGPFFHEVDLPGRAAGMALLFAAFQVVRWRRTQSREQLAERLTGGGAPLPLRVAAKQVGWWYLSSTAVTFVGGAALCAASFLTRPQFTWKHWYSPAAEIGAHTLALAVGAAATALVLGRALRAPVLAEDEASRAVDQVLRAEDVYRFAPCAGYAVLAVPVFVVDWAIPGWLGWSALAYLVTAVVLQLLGWAVVRHRYRRLPPGFYGR